MDNLMGYITNQQSTLQRWCPPVFGIAKLLEIALAKCWVYSDEITIDYK